MFHSGRQGSHAVSLPPGAFDSIRQSHWESQDAERRADASTRVVPSPVSASSATRHHTEQLLASRRDAFNRQNAASRRVLTELAARARELSLQPVNKKVGCGMGVGHGTWGWLNPAGLAGVRRCWGCALC